MNEMPETLRELASEISNPGHKIRARMDAHVAIWEAEQTELLRFRAGASKLQDHIEAIEADRDALREALEAIAWHEMTWLETRDRARSALASLPPEDPRKFGEALPSGIKPGHG